MAGSIPAVASELDEEALDQAVDLDIDLTGRPPVKARCLRAEHVVAIAVKLGRLKDLVRVQALLQEGAVDLAVLEAVLRRHDLMDNWRSFCEGARIEDPLSAA